MLSRFADVSITEVAEEPLQNVSSGKEIEDVKEKEGMRLLEKCKQGIILACDPKGKKFSSEAFAAELEKLLGKSGGVFNFLVGGSYGLSPEVLSRADVCVSFSDMTMPHRLFRVVLMEQVYRAFKIMNGETYHK